MLKTKRLKNDKILIIGISENFDTDNVKCLFFFKIDSIIITYLHVTISKIIRIIYSIH